MNFLRNRSHAKMVGTDYVECPTTPRGNNYILTLTDYFTKCVEAFPTVSKAESSLAECLAKVFYRHDAPQKILSDQRREFVNNTNNFNLYLIHYLFVAVTLL